MQVQGAASGHDREVEHVASAQSSNVRDGGDQDYEEII